MRIYVTDSRVREGVHPVTWKPDGIVVFVVHDRAVSLGGELDDVGGQPVLVSAAFGLGHRFCARQVPLSDVGGAVVRLAETVRQRSRPLRQGNIVLVAAGRGRVESRLQARTRGAAQGLRGEGVEEVRSAAGRAIEVRGEVERVAMQADGVPPLLIGEEDDHVRTIQDRTRYGLLSSGISGRYGFMRILPCQRPSG